MDGVVNIGPAPMLDQLAVERITLLLEHERAKVARPATKVEIVLAEPTWLMGRP